MISYAKLCPRQSTGRLWGLFAFALLFALPGCPKPTTPPVDDADAQPDEDASDVDDGSKPPSCETFCAHLALLKCPEGLDVDCVSRCDTVHADKLINLHDACVVRAKTVNAVRACGPQLKCGAP